MLFASGGGIKGVVQGILRLGLFPAAYMAMSTAAYLWALIGYIHFTTYATDQFRFWFVFISAAEVTLMASPAMV